MTPVPAPYIARTFRLRRIAILVATFASALTLAAPTLPAQVTKTLPSPSDDRWHYPFNATPGTRPNGSTFTTNSASFDYRDAMILMRFRPETVDSLAPNYIRKGMSPECYQFTGAKVVVYHNNALAYTWRHDSGTTDSMGAPFELQIFGMGNDDALTATHATNPFTLETWVETKPFYGKAPGPPGSSTVRNPHPLNVDDGAPTQNVANLPGAEPWGTGRPVYGTASGEYDPGTIPPAPFPVTYTLNLSHPRVRRYIQESLSKGRVDWVISTTASPPGGGPQPSIPDFILSENVANLPPQFILEGFTVSDTRTVEIDQPSDDRWHYPFNGTPGTRPIGPLFTSAVGGGFDYRDAQDLFRFRPENADTLSPNYVEPGLDPASYLLAGARVTVFSPSDTAGLPFTWDTRDTITTDSMGNHPAIQLFGMGNNDALTLTHATQPFSLATWVETSPFFGTVPFPGSTERSPYALNLDATAATQNMSNVVNAAPWALGHPVYGTGPGEYTPGVVAAQPFPITFELDTSNERIREYIQQGLSDGLIDWVVSGTFAGSGGALPQLILSENVLNLPARMEIDLALPPVLSAVRGWEGYE